MKKFVLMMMILSVCSYTLAQGYYSPIGSGDTPSDDYYNSNMGQTYEAGSGISDAPYSTPAGAGPNRAPMGGEEDDDSRPGSHADPTTPIGALPFAFLALLAMGYAVIKIED